LEAEQIASGGMRDERRGAEQGAVAIELPHADNMRCARVVCAVPCRAQVERPFTGPLSEMSSTVACASHTGG
jgi:hypothetical protein